MTTPPQPLQSRTNKCAKRPSSAVECSVAARIDTDFAESAVNDDTATAAETIPCAAMISAPVAAVISSAVDATASEHPRRRRCNSPTLW